MMRKILLIGSGGSGKSTLAKVLARRLGIPVVHLDALYWKAGWQEPPKTAWRETVARLLAQDAWVMDGHFGGTLEQRIAACDTVIYLDLSPWLCAWRVCRRRWQYRGRARPDMAEGCVEKIDLKFLHWILTFRQRKRPNIIQQLDAATQAGKQVFILRSPKAVTDFISGIPLSSP